MIFGKPSNLKKLSIPSVSTGASKIKPSAMLPISKLDRQVNKMVSSGWYHLSSNSRVRKYLTQEATEILIHALVSLKLETYNNILIGIPKF